MFSLLNSFGSYSQTFIQSPKPFVSPLGKLQKLSFTWVDAFNQPLINYDCEFSVVLEVSEMIDVVDTSSILVKGT